MPSLRTSPRTFGAVVVALLLLAAATAPLIGRGADHLDAPGLTSPGGNGAADINDIYAFQGADPKHTVLVMTTNPAAGAMSPATFGTSMLYQIKVDSDGDAAADVTYKTTFGAPGTSGNQAFTLVRAEGADASGNSPAGQEVVSGTTNTTVDLPDGGQFFAGLRSDPFFFDLGGFLGSVEGQGDRRFNDGDQTDPFATFNTLAIVLEVPDSALGQNIGVWGTTSMNGTQLDRMGRPAINTVFNATVLGGGKDAYNAADPANDVATYSQQFTDRLVALTTVVGNPYSSQDAAGIVDLLLPDVLTYDTATAAAGPLNGRALADDVIDAELAIVTNGVVTTDSIGPHRDYLSVFPYLGEPLGAEPPPPPAQTVDLTVTIENLAPANGTFQTPFWVAAHGGSFDVYNSGEAASAALERLAEDGDSQPLSDSFASSGVDATIPGPDGPFAPGDIASGTMTVDPSRDRYFSYASMVIPSNDAFVANGDPQAHELFDANGDFVAQSFFITGAEVLDAGTEVNDESPASTAFFGQMAPDTGQSENGVIGPHAGFMAAGSGGILDAEMFAMADFTRPGYPIAKVSFAVADSQPPPSGPMLRWGTSADRSGGSALEGATISGSVFVWVEPLAPDNAADIVRVEFLVDGRSVHTECCAPFDMIAGGLAQATRPWNSRSVPNGDTVVTARYHFRDGTSQDVTAMFTVAN